MTINSNPAEGMRDLMPKEVELRNYVTNAILSVYKKHGFTQIDTPSAERISLLSSGEGGDNEKMLFKILKRGEKLSFSSTTKEADVVDMGLRYDLTVPLCRYYANKRSLLPQNFKVIQIGSVWRAERPQKGRFRQFTQCDIDVIGVSGVISEIELILATSEALRTLNFKDFKVRINDRRILECYAKYCDFEESNFGKVFIILDKLDKIGIDGVRMELEKSGFPIVSVNKFMDILDLAIHKGLAIENIINVLPNIPKTVLKDLELVTRTVSLQANNEYSIDFDLSLVRGMGYYTGQIFEIGIKGYSSSIAGGGRYDKMIGKILQGKDEIPACGFSIGFERVISILEERQFKVPSAANKIAVLYNDELSSFDDILSQAQKLREEGNIVSLEIHKKKNTKKQLDNLIEQGFTSFGLYEPGQPINIKELKQQTNEKVNLDN
jgi:histidyl-tRNA synthetase